MQPSQDRDHHLVIIGLGATGCCLLPLVATLPIGKITLIDGDTIEERNLPRQPLYGRSDLGKFKVDIAVERTDHLHDHRKIAKLPIFIDKANIEGFLEGATLIADCTDDIHARSLIDRMCGKLSIPLFAGAIHGSQLQVSAFHVGSEERRSVSLRSFFQGRSGDLQDGCDMTNVPIEVPGITAALMCRRIATYIKSGTASPTMDVVDVERSSWIKIAAPQEDDELIA